MPVARERRARELALVVREEFQGRDRARVLVGHDEADDAEHGGAAVLQLDEAAALALGVVPVLHAVDRVPERVLLRRRVEEDRAALAARHVVRPLHLAADLHQTDPGDDLVLAVHGQVVPRVHGRRAEAALPGHARRDVARPRDARAADDEADEGRHGDAAVLELRRAVPLERRAEGRRVREVQRVPGAAGVRDVRHGARRRALEVVERAALAAAVERAPRDRRLGRDGRDVGARAGAERERGREPSHACQPAGRCVSSGWTRREAAA